MKIQEFFGVNNQKRADLLPIGMLSDIKNFERLSSGNMTLRKGTAAMTHSIASGVTSGNTILAIWTWIPSFTLDNMSSTYEYCLLLYMSNGKLYLLYHDTSTTKWESVLAADAEIFDDFVNEPRIAETEYGLAIVDGRNGNNARFIEVNSDGEVIYGDIGIPIAKDTPTITYDKYAGVDDADIGMAVPKGAILFYAYTQVTKAGVESNPSPVFVDSEDNFLDFGTDWTNQQYLKRATLSGLKTIIGFDSSHEELREQLKYFYIYRAHTLYSEGLSARTELLFNRALQIASMDDSNTFVDSNNANGIAISYENDISCKGDDICATGGVTFISNANRAIKFPFDFKYYWKIDIANNNSRNYAQSVILILIGNDDLQDKDGEQKFEWADVLDGDVIDSAYINKLRFFDQDLTTPLKVTFYSLGGLYLRIAVQIPYINSNSVHSIYLCYADDLVGIDETAWQNAEHGEFIGVGDFENQLAIRPNRVRSENTLITMFNELDGTDIINRANEEYPANYTGAGDLVQCTTEAYNLQINFFDGAYKIAGDNGIKWGDPVAANTSYFDFGDLGLGELPSKGFMKLIFFCQTTSSDDPILTFYKDSTNYLTLKRMDVAQKFYFDSVVSALVERCEVSPSNFTTNIYQILCSWDREEGKISLFCNEVKINPTLYSDETDTDIITDFDHFYVGKTPVENTFDFAFIQSIEVEQGIYLSANNAHDVKVALNIMNGLPCYPDDFIGINLDDLAQENITINSAKLVEEETKPGMLMWSSIGGRTFPDLNYIFTNGNIKRIIPAPNYTKNGQDYNSFLIFNKNGTRQRFILSGTPDGWAGQISDNLISEQSAFSLLGENTICKIAETLYYLAPIGLVKENRDGREVISRDERGDKIVDLPIQTDDTLDILFYNQYRQQLIYVYYSGNATYNKAFVYDISTRLWFLFTGFNAERTAVELSKTTQKTLVLYNNTITVYPGSSNTTEASPYIQTGKIALDYKSLRRIKIEYSGTITSIVIVVYNENFSGGYNTTAISSVPNSNVWYGLPRGLKGKEFQITVYGGTNIKQIEIE